MKILRYAHRTLAAAYLLLFVLMFTRTIGAFTGGRVLTWSDAWEAFAVLAVGVWLGWQAGRESKEPQP